MKKASLFTLTALTFIACAAPVGSGDGDGGDGDGDGDGDGTTNTGGTVVTGTGGALGTGGAGPGTGGAGPGTGGALPGTGGTTGGPVTCTGTGWGVNNGYADNGQMCGFAWTGTFADGGTIDPPCGTGDCFMGTTLCASGSIPAQGATSYPGVMIGWNVSQSTMGETAGTWTSSGAGITPTFTTGGGTGETRVVIQSGGSEYCAVATSGQMIPWGSFVVGCWTGGPMTPAFTVGAPVTAIAVQINATESAQTFTDFCLNGITVN